MIRKIRHKSRKRARTDRASRPTLASFAREFVACWACGRTYFLEIHHCAGRAHPLRNDRRLLGRYCCYCHETRWTNPTDGLSPLDRLAQQLAYKFVYDRDYYDLAFVLECKGYAPGALTDAEISVLVKLIREASDG